MHDDINPIISQYVQRPGQPYLSGAFIISAQSGPYGLYGYGGQSIGLATQTCNTQIITVPDAYQKKSTAFTVPTAPLSSQYGVAGAPTAGIYTGVEDSC